MRLSSMPIYLLILQVAWLQTTLCSCPVVSSPFAGFIALQEKMAASHGNAIFVLLLCTLFLPSLACDSGTFFYPALSICLNPVYSACVFIYCYSRFHAFMRAFRIPCFRFCCQFGQFHNQVSQILSFSNVIVDVRYVNSWLEAGGVKFGYTGSIGPDFWGNLSADFTRCSNGKQQSPIDIDTNNLVHELNMEPLHRNYTAASATLVDNIFNVAVCSEPNLLHWTLLCPSSDCAVFW